MGTEIYAYVEFDDGTEVGKMCTQRWEAEDFVNKAAAMLKRAGKIAEGTKIRSSLITDPVSE